MNYVYPIRTFHAFYFDNDFHFDADWKHFTENERTIERGKDYNPKYMYVLFFSILSVFFVHFLLRFLASSISLFPSTHSFFGHFISIFISFFSAIFFHSFFNFPFFVFPHISSFIFLLENDFYFPNYTPINAYFYSLVMHFNVTDIINLQ